MKLLRFTRKRCRRHGWNNDPFSNGGDSSDEMDMVLQIIKSSFQNDQFHWKIWSNDAEIMPKRRQGGVTLMACMGHHSSSTAEILERCLSAAALHRRQARVMFRQEGNDEIKGEGMTHGRAGKEKEKKREGEWGTWANHGQLKRGGNKIRCHVAPLDWPYPYPHIFKNNPNLRLFCHLTPQIFYNIFKITL